MTRFRWWIPAALATLCAAAYANTLHAPFIFDDFFTIVHNPSIRQLWPLSDATASTTPDLWGRPLVALSFKINYALGGSNVVGYHLFNLFLHLLNALLAFSVLRQTLLKIPGMNATDRDEVSWLAFAIAALWMLHPLATESVTYVTQRTELLVGLFLLSTLYCFIRGIKSPQRTHWFGLAVVACMLGMGAKEVMVVAPLLVFVYDYVFGTSSLRDTFHGHAALYAGLAASWIVLAALQLTTNLQWKSGLDVSPTSCWSYLAVQCAVLTHYLHLAIWPSGLVLDYSDWPRIIPLSILVPRAFLLLSLFVASLWAIRQRRWWGFWGAWFFLVLAPSSSFLPLPTEPAAERRMYLPLLAIIAVTLGAAWRAGRRLWTQFHWPDHSRRWLEIAIVSALALALGVTTAQRNAQYRTAESIWADVVAKRPHDARGQTNLALALIDAGKTADAIPHFLIALQLDPNEPIIRNDYAAALVDLGRVDEAIAQLEETLRLAPDYAPARKTLTLISEHRFRADLGRSQVALATHPDDPAAHISIARLFAAMDRRDDAIAQYQQALHLDPSNASAHYNLANLLADYHRDDDALLHYMAAARLDPNDPRIEINLGNLFLKQAHWNKAIAVYAEALRLDPTAFEAHNNIAIAFADRGDLAQAVAHFREAARLRPQQPEIHAELAEVLERQGLHDEAQRESAEAQRLTQVTPSK